MWPSAVRILTIFTLLGFVMSIQPVVVNRALVIPSQSLSVNPVNPPLRTPGTSTSSTASTTTSTTPTSTPDPSSPITNSTSITGDTNTSSSQSSTSRQSSSTFLNQTTSSTLSSSPSFVPTTSQSLPTLTPGSITLHSPSFTVTAVVSTPTDTTTSNGAPANTPGFFANKGAVAGTFLVAGLIGTAFLMCSVLWVIRRFHRHRSRNNHYTDDEYKEFNKDRNGATPTPTLPVTSDPILPASNSSPNMIDHLHSTNVPPPNVFYDPTRGYQRESADFDPYKAYAYTRSEDVHQYVQDVEPYAYEPASNTNTLPPALVAGPSQMQRNAPYGQGPVQARQQTL